MAVRPGLTVTVLAALRGAAPARAKEAVSDAATGFALTLPEGMTAQRVERPDQAVTFAVTSSRPLPRLPASSAHLCQLGYREAPANAALTQAQINAMALREDRQDSVRATVGRAFRVEAMRPFELGGARGLEIVGEPLAGPGAAEVRVVLSLLETPRGRLTMSCATQAADLDAALDAVRALRAGARLPG